MHWDVHVTEPRQVALVDQVRYLWVSMLHPSQVSHVKILYDSTTGTLVSCQIQGPPYKYCLSVNLYHLWQYTCAITVIICLSSPFADCCSSSSMVWLSLWIILIQMLASSLTMLTFGNSAWFLHHPLDLGRILHCIFNVQLPENWVSCCTNTSLLITLLKLPSSFMCVNGKPKTWSLL